MADSNNTAASRLARIVGSDTSARQERTDKLVMAWQDVGPHLQQRRMALNQKIQTDIHAPAPPPTAGGTGASVPPSAAVLSSPPNWSGNMATRTTRLAAMTPQSSNIKASVPIAPAASPAPQTSASAPQSGSQPANFKDMLDVLKDILRELKSKGGAAKPAGAATPTVTSSRQIISPTANFPQSQQKGPLTGLVLSAAMKVLTSRL